MMRHSLYVWAGHYRYPRLLTAYGPIAAGAASWHAFTCLADDTAIVAAWERVAQWYTRWENTTL